MKAATEVVGTQVGKEDDMGNQGGCKTIFMIRTEYATELIAIRRIAFSNREMQYAGLHALL